MGLTTINAKSRPVEHIAQTLVESSNITVGTSGQMKVDPRFTAYDVHTGDVRSGKGVSSSGSKNLGQAATAIPLYNSKFKYSVTSKTRDGRTVNILDTLEHGEGHANPTDYYTGHIQGQIASQVAFELQKRYGHVPTNAEMKAMPVQTIADDQIKLDYLLRWLASPKFQKMYADPKFNAAYPQAKTTYRQLTRGNQLTTIRQLRDNFNIGTQRLTERNTLDKVLHYNKQFPAYITVLGKPQAITEADRQKTNALVNSISVIANMDTTKLTISQLKTHLHTIETFDHQYDAIVKKDPTQRTKQEIILFAALDTKLAALQQIYINLKEQIRVNERIHEQTSFASWKTKNDSELDSFFQSLHNIKNLPTQQARKDEMNRLGSLAADKKSAVLSFEKQFPHIHNEKPPNISADHLITANAYTNWSRIFKYINGRNVYYGIIGGNMRYLDTLPTLLSYTPPKPSLPKPKPKVQVAKTHRPTDSTLVYTFHEFTEDIDKEIKSGTSSGEWSAVKAPSKTNSQNTAFITQTNALNRVLVVQDPSKFNNIGEIQTFMKALRTAMGRQNTLDASKTSDITQKAIIDPNANFRLQGLLIKAQNRYNILEAVRERMTAKIVNGRVNIQPIENKLIVADDVLLHTIHNSLRVQGLIGAGERFSMTKNILTNAKNVKDAQKFANSGSLVSALKTQQEAAIDAAEKVSSNPKSTQKEYLEAITALYLAVGKQNHYDPSQVSKKALVQKYDKGTGAEFKNNANQVQRNKDIVIRNLNILVAKYHQTFKGIEMVDILVKEDPNQLSYTEENIAGSDNFKNWLKRNRPSHAKNFNKIPHQNQVITINAYLASIQKKPKGRGRQTGAVSGSKIDTDSGHDSKSNPADHTHQTTGGSNTGKDAGHSGTAPSKVVNKAQKMAQTAASSKPTGSGLGKPTGLPTNSGSTKPGARDNTDAGTIGGRPTHRYIIGAKEGKVSLGTPKAPQTPHNSAPTGTHSKLPSSKGKANQKVGNIKFAHEEGENSEELIDPRYEYPYFFDDKGSKYYFKPYQILNGQKYDYSEIEMDYYTQIYGFKGKTRFTDLDISAPIGPNGIFLNQVVPVIGGALGGLAGMSNNNAVRHIIGFMSDINSRVERMKTETDNDINVMNRVADNYIKQERVLIERRQKIDRLNEKRQATITDIRREMVDLQTEYDIEQRGEPIRSAEKDKEDIQRNLEARRRIRDEKPTDIAYTPRTRAKLLEARGRLPSKMRADVDRLETQYIELALRNNPAIGDDELILDVLEETGEARDVISRTTRTIASYKTPEMMSRINKVRKALRIESLERLNEPVKSFAEGTAPPEPARSTARQQSIIQEQDISTKEINKRILTQAYKVARQIGVGDIRDGLLADIAEGIRKQDPELEPKFVSKNLQYLANKYQKDTRTPRGRGRPQIEASARRKIAKNRQTIAFLKSEMARETIAGRADETNIFERDKYPLIIQKLEDDIVKTEEYLRGRIKGPLPPEPQQPEPLPPEPTPDTSNLQAPTRTIIKNKRMLAAEKKLGRVFSPTFSQEFNRYDKANNKEQILSLVRSRGLDATRLTKAEGIGKLIEQDRKTRPPPPPPPPVAAPAELPILQSPYERLSARQLREEARERNMPIPRGLKSGSGSRIKLGLQALLEAEDLFGSSLVEPATPPRPRKAFFATAQESLSESAKKQEQRQHELQELQREAQELYDQQQESLRILQQKISNDNSVKVDIQKDINRIKGKQQYAFNQKNTLMDKKRKLNRDPIQGLAETPEQMGGLGFVEKRLLQAEKAANIGIGATAGYGFTAMAQAGLQAASNVLFPTTIDMTQEETDIERVFSSRESRPNTITYSSFGAPDAPDDPTNPDSNKDKEENKDKKLHRFIPVVGLAAIFNEHLTEEDQQDTEDTTEFDVKDFAYEQFRANLLPYLRKGLLPKKKQLMLSNAISEMDKVSFRQDRKDLDPIIGFNKITGLSLPPLLFKEQPHDGDNIHAPLNLVLEDSYKFNLLRVLMTGEEETKPVPPMMFNQFTQDFELMDIPKISRETFKEDMKKIKPFSILKTLIPEPSPPTSPPTQPKTPKPTTVSDIDKERDNEDKMKIQQLKEDIPKRSISKQNLETTFNPAVVEQIRREEKKIPKNRYKVLQSNIYDIHNQFGKAPPVGRETIKTYRKKPFDNMKHDAKGSGHGLRTLVRMMGTNDEIVGAQRRRQILFDNDLFEGKHYKKKKPPIQKNNYNYKRIQ